jgi:hypothetical protein
MLGSVPHPGNTVTKRTGLAASFSSQSACGVYPVQKAPFLLNEYGGSLQDPLSKLVSPFRTVDGASIDNGAIINGTTLDPNTLSIVNLYT